MQNIDQKVWQEKIAIDTNAVILDVRTPMEWQEGIQEGAVLKNIQDTVKFINDIEKMDKTKNYYVYCRSGGRSGQACMLMNAKGFNTFNLIGGMMSWTGNTVQP